MLQRLTLRLPEDIREGLEKQRKQIRALSGLDVSLAATALALLRKGLEEAGVLKVQP